MNSLHLGVVLKAVDARHLGLLSKRVKVPCRVFTVAARSFTRYLRKGAPSMCSSVPTEDTDPIHHDLWLIA